MSEPSVNFSPRTSNLTFTKQEDFNKAANWLTKDELVSVVLPLMINGAENTSLINHLANFCSTSLVLKLLACSTPSSNCFLPTMEFHHRLCGSVSFSYIVIFTIQFLRPAQFAGAVTLLTNQTDQLSLLAFKDQITSDPLRVLSSWNDTIHFCSWEGVTCNGREQRVTVLDLRSKKLVGTISPHVANLTELVGIYLDGNHFRGEIPQELGRLSRLQNLSLSNNSLGGVIPSNLSNCLELMVISLTLNDFEGNFPSFFSLLPKLRILQLAANNLTGTLRPSLGNLTSLIVFSVRGNYLEGSIPSELGKLHRLTFLNLAINQLSGMIPASIYNLSDMTIFSVASNNLRGTIPASLLLDFPKLELLYMGTNQFTGSIPISLPNASSIVEAYFTYNQLTGPVSMNFGELKDLQILSFGNNLLGTDEGNDLEFVDSLANCSNLRVLQLQVNLFTGQMPRSIANLSATLEKLTIGENQLWGTIPAGIEGLTNLNFLSMDHSLVDGTIPLAIGKLNKLHALLLSSTKLSGQIPLSLGNLTELIELHLDDNHLEGNIPSTLGNCKSLMFLNISHNGINGTIPKQLLELPSLSQSLILAHNKLSGHLPSEVSALVNLRELDISENQVLGDIPSSIGSCVVLEVLQLQGNNFQGTIPQSLSEVKGLQILDLSNNELSGPIPAFLQKLSGLHLLNLSFNNLEGEVPMEGVLANASGVSLLGNNKLCGGVSQLNLPACSSAKKKRKRPHIVAIVVVAVLISLLGVISCFIVTIRVRKRRKKEHPPSNSSREKSTHENLSVSHLLRASIEDRYVKVTYSDLFKATDGFSPKNLIGSGSYGSVYKGVLEGDESYVAVKVLDLEQRGALRSFERECEALKGIRHRNLVKVLTVCSSADRLGKEFRALVLEYMPNGNLEEWLHPPAKTEKRNLNFEQRLGVAVDIAAALDYLHNQCETPIVHCDLKPSNILLDDDLCAHLGDFGLARLLLDLTATSLQSRTRSIILKGSIGYVPPEYGMGTNASTQGDVYSYGILLLELFTGKRPTDEMFQEGLDLRRYVKMALPHKVMEVVDRNLIFAEEKDDPSEGGEIIAFLMEMGLRCSQVLPRLRLNIKDVCMRLQGIRKFITTKKMSDSKQLKQDYLKFEVE